MYLAAQPKVYTMSIGDDGQIMLSPRENDAPGLEQEIRDLFYSAIGFKLLPDDMPPPCFDMDELRQRNARVGARQRR